MHQQKELYPSCKTLCHHSLILFLEQGYSFTTQVITMAFCRPTLKCGSPILFFLVLCNVKKSNCLVMFLFILVNKECKEYQILRPVPL